ncbi:hypothetical protein HY488_01250 [Candidatus Woesearchaeota archaeon]|nr:hypothetical protein [Candidatus Woesearchaeota archaeon]
MNPDPATHKKLLEYTMSMLAQGWDVETIKRELKWAGHSPKAIEAVLHEVLANYNKEVHAPKEAVKAVEAEEIPEEYVEESEKKPVPEVVREIAEGKEEEKGGLSTWAALFLMKSTSVEKTFSAIYFLIIFIIIIWSGLATESPVANVFAGFLPIILTIVTIFALHDYFEDEYRWTIVLVPLFWCALFLVAANYSTLPLLAILDVQNIVMLNFVLGIIFIALIYYLGNLERSLVEKERMKAMKKKVISEMTGEERRERHGTALEQLDTIFHELEDHAKHLNMTINKIYSQRHGGSQAMRAAIEIPAEWFQEYKRTGVAYSDAKLKAAKNAITLVYERLADMKKVEKDVFGPAVLELQHLNRDNRGRSKIIDVMVANEPGPIHEHYQKALDNCSKAIEALKQAGLLPKEE